METLTPIEWQVLRLTAGAPENLEQIHDHLCNPPWRAPLADAADAVRSLVAKGVLAPRADGSPPADPAALVWRGTFEPTPEGLEALTAEPARAAGPSSRYGVFKDRGIRLTREAVDEARREMWGDFDRADTP